MDPKDGRVSYNFCVQALKNQPLTIYGNGSQNPEAFATLSDLITALIS